MELDMEQVINDPQGMTAGQLQQRYAEVCGEKARSWNRAWLVKRIAWKVQANAFVDLSERARRRAEELARDSDIRVNAPATKRNGANSGLKSALRQKPKPQRDARLPVPGTVLVRKYKERTYRVTVRDSGFEFGGELFSSLSTVAKLITGAHWNGFLFFRLNRRTTEET